MEDEDSVLNNEDLPFNKDEEEFEEGVNYTIRY